MPNGKFVNVMGLLYVTRYVPGDGTIIIISKRHVGCSALCLVYGGVCERVLCSDTRRHLLNLKLPYRCHIIYMTCLVYKINVCSSIISNIGKMKTFRKIWPGRCLCDGGSR